MYGIENFAYERAFVFEYSDITIVPEDLPLRAMVDSDRSVPVGAAVVVDGHAYPVGTQGLAQLPVGRERRDAVVSWPGGRCRVLLPAVAAGQGDGTGQPQRAGPGGPGRGGGHLSPYDRGHGGLLRHTNGERQERTWREVRLTARVLRALERHQ